MAPLQKIYPADATVEQLHNTKTIRMLAQVVICLAAMMCCLILGGLVLGAYLICSWLGWF
jgi:hypothetical protein